MNFVPIVDAASFRRNVVLGTTSEDRSLEFKAEYRWQKDRSSPEDRAGQAEELCRDVVQFANTDGGILLVGVSEREEAGRKIADGIRNVENVDGLKQWVEEAIRKHLTPSTFSRSTKEIVLPEGTILAINVPPSLHLVALWLPERKKGIEYLYRTDHGKEHFNPDEVERHIMNGSRAMQIRLATLIAELSEQPNAQIPVALTPAPRRWLGQQNAWAPCPDVLLAASGCSEDEIELRFGNVGVRLPHGLIVEAWRTNDRKLGLCLKVAMVLTDERTVALSLATG